MSEVSAVDTPGYFYALSYCVIMITLLRIMTKETVSVRHTILDLLALILISGLMIVTGDAPQVWFLPIMSGVLLLIFLYIWQSGHLSVQEVIFYGIKYFICGEMVASLSWQIYYWFHALIPAGWDLFFRILILILMLALCTAGLGFLEVRLGRDDLKLQIGWRDVLVAVLLFIIIYTISNLSYLTSDSLFSAEALWDLFIIRTLVDMIGVAIFYAYTFQTLNLQRQMEVLALEQIMDAQYKNYKLSKDSMDMVNQKYHDLKHQITVLKEEASEESVRDLEQMEQEIKIYEAQNKTGNAILDTVLMSKSAVCQDKGIELRSIADGESLSFMSDMDLSALFGNMLDNAIDCEEKIPEPEKRQIRLNIVREKQFVRILEENYCEEKISFRNGLPQTNKQDKNMHGYGMKSMQNTVRKYGGSLVASQKDHWYELKILLPIPVTGEKT